MFKDFMVQACLWSNLFYSMSYPFIHVYLMRQVSEKLVSVNQVFSCICIIIINSLWNKRSNNLYKLFPLIMMIEAVSYLILNLAIIIGVSDGVTYYIVDTLLFCLISRNMICGANKLRSLIYIGDSREKYDNTIPIAASIATLIGGTIAIIVNIPINVAFMISWVGLSIDNLFYYLAYRKNQKSIQQSDTKED